MGLRLTGRLSGVSLGAIGGHTAARVAGALLSFASTLMLTRVADAATVGRYGVVVSAFGLTAVVADLGLRNAGVSAIGRSVGTWGQTLRSYIGVRFASGAVGAVALGAYVAIALRESLLNAVLASAGLLAGALLVDWLHLAARRHTTPSLVVVARPASFLMMAYGLVATRGKLSTTAVLCVFAISWYVPALVSWLGLRRSRFVWPDPTTSSRRTWATLLALGRGNLYAAALTQASMSVDLLILGRFIRSSQLASYYIATAIAAAVMVAGNGAQQVVMGAGASDRGSWKIEQLRRSTLLFTVMGVAAAAVALVAGVAAPAIFGPEYAHTAWLMLWLTPYVAFAHGALALSGFASGAGRAHALVRPNAYAFAVVAVTALIAATTRTPAMAAAGRSLAAFVLLGSLVRRARLLLPAKHVESQVAR